MQLTVAIVSWNTRELLARCLESMPQDADVWVVDNGSTDGSAEMVRERFPQVHLEALDENIGFGRAINRIAAQTSSEWIAIANADVHLATHSVANCTADP